MMDQKVALYLQMDGTDTGSNVLDDSIRIQVFWQTDKDKSKSFLLDKNKQLHK